MPHRRDLSQSEWFHLVQRGADRQDIFSAPSHRTVYESLVDDAFGRFEVELHAYAWMTNHTHMLVHAPQGGLPDAMHLLGSRYATAYNRWTGRDGPLFTSRYFSKPIVSDAQLTQTARYIHRNPLAFVPVAALSAYGWSSLGVLCGRRSVPEWLSTGIVTDKVSAGTYLEYVLTPQPADRHGFGELPPSTPTDLHVLDAAVAAVTGREVDRLRAITGRRTDLARVLVITMAVEFRVGDSDELARHYGVSDRRSVRRIARRGRVLLTSSDEARRLRAAVMRVLDTGRFPETRAPGTLGRGTGDAA